MNTAVTATGMSVKAKTEGGLAIAAYTIGANDAPVAPASTAFASTAAAVYKANATVAPTSFSGSTWYKAEAENANNYVAKAGSYATVADAALDNYRLISKFQIKSMDTASDTSPVDLFVTAISVSGDTNSTVLNKSLRVVVKCSDTYYYFAPLYTEVSGGNLFYYNGSARTAKAVDTAITINNATFAGAGVQIMDDSLTTSPANVDIYIYYEGEDENCKSINAVNIDTLTVQVTFATQVS